MFEAVGIASPERKLESYNYKTSIDRSKILVAHPFDVVANVDLLVLRVRSVVRGAHRQQNHILARHLLRRKFVSGNIPIQRLLIYSNIY